MWAQCLVLAAVAVSLAVGQDLRPRAETQRFRITAERIQFDALFLDGQNRPIADIRLDEVTVRQAGVVVPLSDLRFQSRVNSPTATSAGAMRESRNATQASGAPTMATEDTDAWVFLIDDLAMSPDGFARAKNGLLAVLEHEIPPRVVVGILRTGVLGTHQTRLSDDRAELRRSVASMRHQSNRWRGGVMSRSGVTRVGSRRRVDQAAGLHAVADELGGLYFGRSNDVGALLDGVLAVEQGHYVLAYEPPAGTFDDGGKPRFIDVSVAVSRPGVTVKTRTGFFTR